MNSLVPTIGSGDGDELLRPPTPPDIRFSVSGGWTQRLVVPQGWTAADKQRPPGLVHCFRSGVSRLTLWLPPASARHGSTASASACSPCAPGLREPFSRCARFSSSSAPWSFGPSLQRCYPPSSLLWLLLTSPPLSRRRSSQVRRCFFPFPPSGSTSDVVDGFRASLWPASLPPVRGLSAGSCSYGQWFVPRFLQLGLAASALRFPTVTSIGPGEYFSTHKKQPMLEIVPNLVEGGRAAVLKLGSLRESSKPFTTKENRREETISHSRFRKATASQPPRSHSPAQPKRAAHAALG